MANNGGNMTQRKSAKEMIEQIIISGMTQTELAQAVEVNQAQISRIRAGKQEPTIATYFAIEDLHNKMAKSKRFGVKKTIGKDR